MTKFQILVLKALSLLLAHAYGKHSTTPMALKSWESKADGTLIEIALAIGQNKGDTDGQ